MSSSSSPLANTIKSGSSYAPAVQLGPTSFPLKPPAPLSDEQYEKISQIVRHEIGNKINEPENVL